MGQFSYLRVYYAGYTPLRMLYTPLRMLYTPLRKVLPVLPGLMRRRVLPVLPVLLPFLLFSDSFDRFIPSRLPKESPRVRDIPDPHGD